MAGPGCPVESYPPDPACALRPVDGEAGRPFPHPAGGSRGGGRDARQEGEPRLATGRYRLTPRSKVGLVGTPPPVTFKVSTHGMPVHLAIEYVRYPLSPCRGLRGSHRAEVVPLSKHGSMWSG